MSVISLAFLTGLVLTGLALLDLCIFHLTNTAAIVGISIVIIVFAGLLTAVVIYTLTNISIGERNREIATLMVLGYSDKEVTGYIYREIYINSLIGALFGGLPTATFSQNVGIVTTTKVINRSVLGLAALILAVAGVIPKFSALLTTIPQCVLGGATISVFASIAMTGIRLMFSSEMNQRSFAIVGLAVALGMGVYQSQAALAAFPEWVTTIFGKSPVVLATIVAILLNLVLPKVKEKTQSSKN